MSAEEAECELCTTIVGAVEDYVIQDYTPDQILAEIETVCNNLPALVIPFCKNLIEDNLAPILDNLADQLQPYAICKNLGVCTTPPAPSNTWTFCLHAYCIESILTHFIDPWTYIETYLEGGQVLSLRYDGSHVVMWGKDGSDYELWRLDYNGCLRNRKYPNYCLGSGLTLHIEHEILEEQQRWSFNNGYLQTKVNRQESFIFDYLIA